MFCSRRDNNRTSKLREQALRLSYDDYKTLFLALLAIDLLASFTVPHANVQTILLEIYKIKHNLSESFLKDPFSVVNGSYKFLFSI